MKTRGGRRARDPAAAGRRPEPASGRNASRGRAKLSGSLYLSGDGKSKFYPEGGEQPKFPSGVKRPDQRGSSSKRPRLPLPASSARYYNNTFYTGDPKVDKEESDDDSNYGSEAPPTPQQAIMRTFLTYCVLGFVVVVIIVAAIIVPVVILAGKSTGPTVTGFVSIRMGFTSLLDDTSSSEYINLKADFESALNQIFQNSATYVGDFKESTVTDFEASVTTTTTKVDFSVFFNAGVVITRIFRNNVFTFITVETRKTGSPFALLDVVPSTLNITESCGIHCENAGTLSVISCTCTCATGFSGTTCTTTA